MECFLTIIRKVRTVCQDFESDNSHSVEITQHELKGENYDEKEIEGIREKLDLEMKSRWNLVRIIRKYHLDRVEKILRKEYVLNI